MLVLDTDHLTIIQRTTEPAYTVLRNRLQQARPRESYTTVVSFEEQMRGWLAEIGRRRDVREQITDYENLAKLVRFFNRWPLVPLDERAVDEFNILRKQRIRLLRQSQVIIQMPIACGVVLPGFVQLVPCELPDRLQ